MSSALPSQHDSPIPTPLGMLGGSILSTDTLPTDTLLPACELSAPEMAEPCVENLPDRIPAVQRPLSAQNPAAVSSAKPSVGYANLHHVREIRIQQGISERTVARRLGIEVKRYREMEKPTFDLTVSQLGMLQQALEVPLIDLIEDSQALSRPVAERAKMIKVMKTACALRDLKSSQQMERMTQMLCEQLVDLMPELAEVSGWPQFGARRGESAIGRALRQPIDTSDIGLP